MPESESWDEAPVRTGSERRDYYRVKARIPIRVRAVDPSEIEHLALEITTPRDESATVADPALQAALQSLERKLDLVLAQLDHRFPQPLGEADMRNVSLSGGGVAIEGEDGIDLDDPVLVEFLLPGVPSRSVRALAHPVAVQGPESDAKGGPLALAFEVMADTDRDAIVRFSHDLQRTRLRERALRVGSK